MTEHSTDTELVRAILQDETDAFAFVVRRYQDRIFSFLLRVCRNPAEAEDLTQETFIKAFGRLGSYNTQKPMISWLFAIAHNSAVDSMRRRGEPASALENEDGTINIADTAAAVERVVAGRLELQQVERALEKVPAACREALLLHAREDLSYEEIAGITGASPSTVKIRIFRARQALAGFLEKDCNFPHA
ncbi:MAG: RNA polymerase sigma factor [Elusimicrobiaceae bacterium]|nr:RNA polymerase sigma factor [Elusimicrobiaceae bacterium]